MSSRSPAGSSAPLGGARRVQQPSTLLIWTGVLLVLIVVLGVRLKQARTQAALAEHQVSMHDAPSFLDSKLTALSPAQRRAAVFRYAQDVSAGVRFASVDMLVADGSRGALDAVEHDFTDNASEVRKRAMETLLDMKQGEQRGLHLLLAGVRDDDLWIRQDALSQLSIRAGRPHSLIDKRAIPTLIAALEDHDAVVCATAAGTLSKLTGHPWKTSLRAPLAQRKTVISQWEQWWQRAQQNQNKDQRNDWSVPAEFLHVAPIVPTRSDPSPNFVLMDVHGQRFSTSDLRGKITLLNFWGTWCPPCKAEIPDLVKIDETYKTSNVVVIGMACSEKSPSDLKSWCQEHHVGYRQTMATSEVQKAFDDIEEVPVSFLIDARGCIRYRWDGERDFETFQAAIERLRHEPEALQKRGE